MPHEPHPFLKVYPWKWSDLNTMILEADEDLCLAMLQKEGAHRKSLRVLLRIHSRMNRLRAVRERKELAKISGGKP